MEPPKTIEAIDRLFDEVGELFPRNPAQAAAFATEGFLRLVGPGFEALCGDKAPPAVLGEFVGAILRRLASCPVRAQLASDPAFADYRSWLDVPSPPPSDIVRGFVGVLRARHAVPAPPPPVKPPLAAFRASFSRLDRVLQRLGASLGVARALLLSRHPLASFRLARDLAAAARSGLFDRDFYAWSYPDVTARRLASPLLHYCLHGWREGRRFSPAFPPFPPDLLPVRENPLLLHRRLFPGKKPTANSIRRLFRELRPDRWASSVAGRLRAEAAPKPPLAVAVPVHNHPELLPPLVASLLEHTPPDVLLLFVDDASSDSRVRSALLRLAAAFPGRVQVECLADNLGYAGACNHALRAAGRRDVILLNSDTVVGPRWTDSLRLAAYAGDRIGSATAVSDNSGLVSVPNRKKNEMPPGLSVASVACGWLHAPETAFDLHAGHGFCLYLRRDMLDDVGDFDAAVFGKGYGEEADLCLRAWERGWKHRITTRAFVWHLNAASFGNLYKLFKIRLSRHALVLRHPDLDALEKGAFPRWDAFSPWFRHLAAAIAGGAAPPRPRVLFLSRGPVPPGFAPVLSALRSSFDPFWTVFAADGTAVLQDLSARALGEDGPVGAMLERGRGGDDEIVSWILEYGVELVAPLDPALVPPALRRRLAALHIPVLDGLATSAAADPNRAAARLGARFLDALSFAPAALGDAIFAAGKTRDLLLPAVPVPGAFDPAAFDRTDLSAVRELVLERFPLPVSDDTRLLLLSRLCGIRLRIRAKTENPHLWIGSAMPHFRLLAAADAIEKLDLPPLDAEYFPSFPQPPPPPAPALLAERAKAYRKARAACAAPASHVVYTAIAGRYESLKIPESPDPEVDYVYFAPAPVPDDGPWTWRPFAWTDEDPTRTARWHKLHAPDLFPDAETVAWIDGNITLLPGVEREIREKLLAGPNPIAALRHFDRDNIFDEAEACIARGKDDPALLRAQVARYRAAGLPDCHPFAENCIVASLPSSPLVRAVFASWWRELAAGSRRDQLSFPFALWENGANFTPLFDRNIRLAVDKVRFARHVVPAPSAPCPHARQFVLSRRRFDYPGFRHLELPNGFVLSFHPGLRVRATPDRRTVLLGLAWSCDPSVPDPLAAAAACPTDDDLERLLDSWSGRWILLRDGRLRMDACGLLGVFFRGADCSSSLALLGRHLGFRPRRPGLRHQFGGMDFYPGPLTPQLGVFRLLPSQGFDLAAAAPFERPPEPAAPDFPSEVARVAAVLDAFDVLLPRIAADYPGRVRLPLTAGYDSRTLAALLHHAGVAFDAFTLDHRRLRAGDRDIPPRLSAVLGRPHRFVPRPAKPDEARFRAWDAHCAGLAVDEDRNFYAFRQYPEPAEPSCRVAVLRGGVWESVREYYRVKHKLFRTASDLSEFKSAFLNVRFRPDLQRAFAAWLDHCRAVPSPLDPVDRYYLEQRAGAWLSSAEQSLDIIPGMDSIQPCNCRRILSILRSFAREDRIACRHQVAIIRAACPALLDLPFQGSGRFLHGDPNARPAGFSARLARKRRTVSTFLHCLGFRGTLRFLFGGRA
jgi:GT2 family glycosyltransferase